MIVICSPADRWKVERIIEQQFAQGEFEVKVDKYCPAGQFYIIDELQLPQFLGKDAPSPVDVPRETLED